MKEKNPETQLSIVIFWNGLNNEHTQNENWTLMPNIDADTSINGIHVRFWWATRKHRKLNSINFPNTYIYPDHSRKYYRLIIYL